MSSRPTPPELGRAFAHGGGLQGRGGHSVGAGGVRNGERGRGRESLSPGVRATPHGGAIHLVGFYNDYDNFLAVKYLEQGHL